MKQTLHKMCAKEQGNRGKSTSHSSPAQETKFRAVDNIFKISGD